MTVTRLAEDRFRVVTGAGYLAADLAWLRAHAEAGDGAVAIRDVSDELATIGLWGPRARDDPGRRGAPTTRSATRRIPMRRAGADPDRPGAGPAPPGSATPASSAGSCTIAAGWAVAVWDRLRAAGAAHGLEPFGYRALDVAPAWRRATATTAPT